MCCGGASDCNDMDTIADLILLLHCAFVLFVVGGLPAIWIGATRGWQWVRNRWFRLLHLAAIVFVSIEAILGMACPLTVWEDALRGALTESSFVARWLRRLLYYSFPEWVFACAYLLFALAVLAAWWKVPPRPWRNPHPLK
jgi:hypothetical protein